MYSQLFHDYKIQHDQSPDRMLVKATHDHQPSLKENLMILNQFFIQNPLNLDTKSKPQNENIPKVNVRQEIENEPDSEQKMLFLNLSAFKKSKPVEQIQQNFTRKTYFANNNQFQQNLIQALEVNQNTSPYTQQSQRNLFMQQHNPKALQRQPQVPHQVGSSKKGTKKSTLNVAQRNQLWNEVKMGKTEARQKQKLQDELLDCTFKPATSTRNRSSERLHRSETAGTQRRLTQFIASPNSNESRLFTRVNHSTVNINTLVRRPTPKSSQTLSRSQSKNSQSFRAISYSEIYKSKQSMQRTGQVLSFDQNFNY